MYPNPIAYHAGLRLLDQLHGEGTGRQLIEAMKNISPDFVTMTIEWAMAGITARPGLDLLTREYLIIASCVTLGHVRWVEGSGFPNAATVGRNTLRTGGTNNFDLNLTKSIPFGETRRVELRWEVLNAFNHPQFVNVPQMSVNGTPSIRFLNRDFTDSGIRSMWVQAKIVF